MKIYLDCVQVTLSELKQVQQHLVTTDTSYEVIALDEISDDEINFVTIEIYPDKER